MTIRQTMYLILTPILAMCILSFGNGYFTTFASLHLTGSGWSSFTIGIVSASYFLGLTMGSYFSQFTIIRVGFIRAFVLFASLMSISTMILGVVDNQVSWAVFRFVCGYSLAALFIIIESWCLLSSEKKNRGFIFSIYLFLYYGTQAMSQLMINLHFSNTLIVFGFVSILCSIAIVLMSFTKSIAPSPHTEDMSSAKQIVTKVPLAIVASFVGGLLIGSIYSMLPIFLVKVDGSGSSLVSILMMTTILGGMALQIPIGKISDMVDRRLVILVVSILIAVTSLLICFIYSSLIIFAILTFIFGGCAFVIYPLSISHASDFLEEHEILAAIGLITIFYGFGSVMGPLLMSGLMQLVGPFGFFIVVFVIAVMLSIYVSYRLSVRPATKDNDSAVFTPMTPETVGFVEAKEVVSDMLTE